MLWLLVLHISALLFWCAALLYLPVLIVTAASHRNEITSTPRQHASIARFLFTHVATPAALAAIVSGTVIFIAEDMLALWLIAKLTLVVGLVVTHALLGLLVLRAEHINPGPLRRWCWAFGVILPVLMLTIVWLVLAKPAEPLA